MQAAQAKQVVKPELTGKVYDSAISSKADNVKVQESNAVDLQKQANYKRMFEACNDCV